VNYVPYSSYYVTASQSGVVFTESYESGKIINESIYVVNTTPEDDILKQNYKRISNNYIGNTTPEDDILKQNYKRASMIQLPVGYPLLVQDYKKFEF